MIKIGGVLGAGEHNRQFCQDVDQIQSGKRTVPIGRRQNKGDELDDELRQIDQDLEGSQKDHLVATIVKDGLEIGVFIEIC